MSDSNASTSSSVTTTSTAEPSSNQRNNLQRIALKKHQLKAWSRNKKLEKLAIYSQCRADHSQCKCNGWKNPNNNPIPTSERHSERQNHAVSQMTDPCRSCGHQLSESFVFNDKSTKSAVAVMFE